jgi:hypothetical protein
VVELAHAGDVACHRMLMDRYWPRRDRPVTLDMPPLRTAGDILSVTTHLWRAIAEGRLTPDQGSALSLVAERSMYMISQSELLKRIEVLERERGRQDATESFEAR